MHNYTLFVTSNREMLPVRRTSTRSFVCMMGGRERERGREGRGRQRGLCIALVCAPLCSLTLVHIKRMHTGNSGERNRFPSLLHLHHVPGFKQFRFENTTYFTNSFHDVGVGNEMCKLFMSIRTKPALRTIVFAVEETDLERPPLKMNCLE